MNGVWRWPAVNKKNYPTWKNNGKICYYIPEGDCEKIATFNEITNIACLEEIEKQQKAWKKYMIKKGKMKPDAKDPDWFLHISVGDYT